jgi:hypothetical protein
MLAIEFTLLAVVLFIFCTWIIYLVSGRDTRVLPWICGLFGAIALTALFIAYKTTAKACLGWLMERLIVCGIFGGGVAVGSYCRALLRRFPFSSEVAFAFTTSISMIAGILFFSQGSPNADGAKWPQNYATYFDYSVSRVDHAWKLILGALGVYKGIESIQKIRHDIRKTNNAIPT